MLCANVFTARTLSLVIIVSWSAWCAPASATERAGTERFNRRELLGRFDANQDGTLDHAEIADLRAAFGNLDVPMLPAKPYRYASNDLSYVTPAQLVELDNSPEDNPLTDAGAALGRVLFYDTQLSANNTISCASCHVQEYAFADPRQFSIGFQGGTTRRNAMSLVNLRYTNINGSRPGFFWDERAPTLEAQVLMPIEDALEMGSTLRKLPEKLEQLPYYPVLFEAAYGDRKITVQRIARAVAQFMRAMVSFDSHFDRAARAAKGDYGRDFSEFSAEENLGKSLFIRGVDGIGEIGCAHCHVPPTFGMPQAFNNGLERQYADPGLGDREVPSNDPFTPSNDGKFKAPSLRNVAVTAPYMHDGRFQTLQEVVEHYSSGVHPHPNVGLAFRGDVPGEAKETSGFQLSAAQKSALIAFLKTLTDRKFLTDPRFADPFVRLGNQVGKP